MRPEGFRAWAQEDGALDAVCPWPRIFRVGPPSRGWVQLNLTS